MVQIIETIDVDVPVRRRLQPVDPVRELPEFLDEVESITQTDDTHTHWKVKVGGSSASSTPRSPSSTPTSVSRGRAPAVTPSTPASSRSTSSPTRRSRVTVQLDWEPEGFLEKVGSLVGAGLARGEEGPEELQGVHREASCRDRGLARGRTGVGGATTRPP